VVRIAIDRSTGRFATRQDTMAHGVFTAFSLTGDGAKVVMDEGTFEHSVWAMPVADAVKGTFLDERRVARASTAVGATISPDGARMLMRRVVPTGGRSETRWSIMPFDGGAETPLPAPGVIRRAKWSDAQHVATSMHTPNGLRLSDIDARSGAVRSTIQLPDSVVADWTPLPNGWAWIPVTRDRIVVSEGGRRREFRPPAWFAGIAQLSADRTSRRIFYVGSGRATGDTAGVAALSLDDGKSTLWATHFAEEARVMAASAHRAVFAVATTQDSWSLFGLDGPGATKPLGTIGRPIFGLSVSEDLSRAAIMVLDYRADAWMNEVVAR
jgi:hypothetical protein